MARRVTLGGARVTFHPAGHVLGSAQIAVEAQRRCASSPRATTRTSPIRPARRSSWSPATSSSPRRRSACRCSATAIRTREIAKLLHSVALFPERAHLVGAYSLGKAQRVIALIRAAGYDKPIYLHGAMESITRYYEQSRHRARRVARGARAPSKAELAGAIALCPPSALQDCWTRRFPDPVAAFASGWMRVRARARQRGVELPLVISDHADWDGLTATIAATGAREIWVTHGQEDALVHWCTSARARGAAARHRRLWRRGRGATGDARRGMNRFAELLDRLAYEPSRNDKLRLMTDYFREHARSGSRLGAGGAHRRAVVPARQAGMIRALIAERTDPVLFELSYDYVGDLVRDGRADVAGAGPPRHGINSAPTVAEVIDDARHPRQGASCPASSRAGSTRSTRPAAGRCSSSSPARCASACRRGSPRPRSAALGDKDAARDRAGLAGPARRPTRELFAWLEGRAEQADDRAIRRRSARRCWRTRSRRPTSPRSTRRDFMAEWKWDGIRVQAVAGTRADGTRVARLYSRTGEDIRRASPTWSRRCGFDGAIDGELLVLRERPRAVLQRAAAAAQPQDRHAPSCSPSFPRICAPTICWSRARTICASGRSPSGARGSKRWSRASTIRASTSRRWCRSDLGRAGRRARRPGAAGAAPMPKRSKA